MTRRLEQPDSRVLDITWSQGTVHLYVEGVEVLTMSAEVAARHADLTRTCSEAAAHHEAGE